MNKIKKKALLLVLPIILLIIYFSAGVFYDPIYVIYSKPFIVPAFLLYAISTHREKLTSNYLLFVAFFYANELFLLLWQDYIFLFKVALITSFFSYLSLIILGYKIIKNKNIYSLPKGFSLFILFLNGVFLLAILIFLIAAIGDIYINIILVFNALIAIILGVTAVLYLNNFTNKKTYFYFFGSFALILSDVSGAIGSYFMHNVYLNSLDRLLHFLAFYLIYLFIIKDSTEKNKHQELQGL
jgi:hypothetical protein